MSHTRTRRHFSAEQIANPTLSRFPMNINTHHYESIPPRLYSDYDCFNSLPFPLHVRGIFSDSVRCPSASTLFSGGHESEMQSGSL